MSDGVIIALAAAGAGIVGAVLNQIFSRKTRRADAAATNVSASIELVEALRGEVNELRKEQGKLKDEVVALRAELESIEIVSDLRMTEIAKLKSRIDAANKIIDAQEVRIDHLERALRLAGIDPDGVRGDDDVNGVVF